MQWLAPADRLVYVARASLRYLKIPWQQTCKVDALHGMLTLLFLLMLTRQKMLLTLQDALSLTHSHAHRPSC